MVKLDLTHEVLHYLQYQVVELDKSRQKLGVVLVHGGIEES